MSDRPDPAAVSPADTPDVEALRMCISQYVPEGGKDANDVHHAPLRAVCLAALDELLAVGERDKAEIEELRGELAVAYGGPDRDGKQREWFSALDRAKAEAEDLREAGERDRQQITQLTEALRHYANEENWSADAGPVYTTFSYDGGKSFPWDIARAVLAGEEDTDG